MGEETIRFKLTQDNKEILVKSIRETLKEKENAKPRLLSPDSYEEWLKENPGAHIHYGIMSIWDKVEHHDNCPVVIRKKNCRDNETPFLVFDSNRQFVKYCDSCQKAGTVSYYLVDEWLTAKLIKSAQANSIPEAAVEEIQNAIECNVGIYFDMPEESITDEHLFLSICAYIKKISTQKTATVFGKHSGNFVYLDGYDFDFLSAEDEENLGLFSVDTDNGNDVHYDVLVGDVAKMIATLLDGRNSGSRYDIKDNLLPVVISSKKSVVKFLEEYYAKIKGRTSIWRPVSLSYQVTYSHDNGREFLKNPIFISRCADTEMGDIVSYQTDFSKGKYNLCSLIGDVRQILANNGQLKLRLIDCADSAEQIGKALSKELRTKEALGALAKSLPIAAAEMNPDIRLSFPVDDEVSQDE